MLKQKFRRGNLVHIKQGSCQFNFEQGCNAIILGSYGDYYNDGDIFQYRVIFPDDGREVAWCHDEQLVLIEDGGEHLIEQVQENTIRREAKKILLNKDLNHLGEGEIITLLRFIGFDYSVSNNYFKLWERILPLFERIKNTESCESLKEEYPDYDIEDVWNVYHNLRK